MEDEREVLSGHRQQVGPVVAAGGQHDVLRQVAELFAEAVELKRLFIHQTAMAVLFKNQKSSGVLEGPKYESVSCEKCQDLNPY